MSDGSLISSCTLALARRFSTTLRRNLQAPVRRSCPSSLQRRIHLLLPFFFYLFISRARALVGAGSDNPRHRSLSFRIYRSRLRLPTTMNRHPYFEAILFDRLGAISGVITRNTELIKMNLCRDWWNYKVSARVELFEEAQEDRKNQTLLDREYKRHKSISSDWYICTSLILNSIASNNDGFFNWCTTDFSSREFRDEKWLR